MKKKYLLRSSERIALFSRLMAKGIDIFIVMILSMFFYPLGILLAAIYLAFADSLQNGQSVGKKFIGFAVISLEDGKPCSLKQSIIRNLPFLVPLCFAIIPFWGWIFSILLGVPLLLLELYLLFKLDSGHRLGDVMADTTVIANDGHRMDLRKKKRSWYDQETVIPS
jgi:uncharacterized RDD family membrane protein YckC